MSTITRTDLLALLDAYIKAESTRQGVATLRVLGVKDATEYETVAKYDTASDASTKAYGALIDCIFASGIPA